MKFPRRQFLHLAAGAAALPAMSQIARAQAYPTRPVRIIVPFPAGGGVDIAARLVGQWLSERLARQFVVEKRVGAGGNIGTEAVVKAPPDGYTLLQVATPNGLNAALYPNLNFDFIRDIVPVIGVMRTSYVMVVHPSVPAATIPDFIAYAKANPGKINMASAGNGTPHHIFGELFKMMAGIDLTHIPYRGGAPATTDLLGGQVQVIFSPLQESIEYIKAGKLRALAVTTATHRTGCGVGRYRVRGRAYRLRKGYLGRHRKVEEGGQVREHKTGLILRPRYSINLDTRADRPMTASGQNR